MMQTRRTALVFGSAQSLDGVDLEPLRANGVEIARRRSGGGAVLIVPGQSRWIDLVIPADDPLWESDVSRAVHWVGTAWAGALRELGLPAEVHAGPVTNRAEGRVMCFAGLGPGEVTVAGRKTVGISQRRTRGGARFQCMVHSQFDAVQHAAVLCSDSRWAEMVEHLAVSVGVVPAVDDAVEAFIRRLP